ncbi:response regulator transcription factor [Streptococcus pseudopneumoniae]|uniref:LytR/AlgR family response regulator transcription factor n=2 Tax=Streptococcus pseudopneumoniae TaxID=257758 RepID=UPI00110C20A1|nr:LytTR family DNA-binding domain-containing protein [Streptococcus pseudopneumoniae]MBF9658902.1 response regulator transcription factor [Streptococcus pseudopneumoniae]TMR45466.1 response regulator transcription factor [Streptococcus pseudopneumoniae]
MLKIAICDDSNRDGSQLENLLLSYKDIKIETSVYTNPQKLLEQLTEKYSCVFLDIEMPQITGIDMAQKIRKVNPFIPIIFVTSYRDYMEQVFEVQTFDYLLKPVTSKKLYKTLDRVVRFLNLGQAVFTFTFGKQHYSLPLNDIVFFEKDKRAVFIYTKDQTYKALLKTKDILEKLPDYFIQIHSSYIINPRYVTEFDSQIVTILNGMDENHLPISRKFQTSFREKYYYYYYLSERNF